MPDNAGLVNATLPVCEERKVEQRETANTRRSEADLNASKALPACIRGTWKSALLCLDFCGR